MAGLARAEAEDPETKAEPEARADPEGPSRKAPA
jgi:hypothetical protein